MINKRQIILLIFVFIVVIGVVSFIYTRSSPTTTTPSSSTQKECSWNGLAPGTSTREELIQALGSPTSEKAIDDNKDVLSFPSENKYWPNEVTITTQNTIESIRVRRFGDENRSLSEETKKLGGEPTMLYGPDTMSDIYLFVFLQKGVAFRANKEKNTIYDSYYFSPTTIEGFLQLSIASGYSVTQQKQNYAL